MNNQNLMNAINGLSDKTVESTLTEIRPKKNTTLKKWLGVGAGIAAAVALTLFLSQTEAFNKTPALPNKNTAPARLTQSNTPQPQKIENGKNIKSNTAGCMVSPEPGQKVFDFPVQEAIQMYKGTDTLLFVQIMLFKDSGLKEKENGRPIIEPLSDNSPEVTEELARLQALGFEAGFHDYWGYEGAEADHAYYTCVYGLFTADDLLNFSVNQDLGYAFVFVRNGDGTFVEY